MRKEMQYALDVAAHKEMCANAKSIESIDFAQKVCFVKGANWFRNNLWHDASEKPVGDNPKLLVYNERENWITINSYSHCKQYIELNNCKWCYKEDILPDKEYEVKKQRLSED